METSVVSMLVSCLRSGGIALAGPLSIRGRDMPGQHHTRGVFSDEIKATAAAGVDVGLSYDSPRAYCEYPGYAYGYDYGVGFGVTAKENELTPA